MKLGFLSKALGQNSSHYNFRCIYFYNKGFLGIWLFQDGCSGECCLELVESCLGCGVPGKVFLSFLDEILRDVIG